METVEMSSIMKMKNKSDRASVDLTELAESVRADLEALPSFSESCCMYKVPDQLLRLNENAYTPRVVSIGPIHHGKAKLISMEEHKKMYLRDFLRLSEVRLEELVEYIWVNEAILRNCYPETIELSSKDFVKMMLMDATFVIMIVLYVSGRFDRNSVDRMACSPMKMQDVGYDLCLLENQLPFFILDELLTLSNIVNVSMAKLTHEFLKFFWGPWVGKDLSEEINSSTIENLVDFLGIFQKPSKPQPTTEWEDLFAPSVKQLQQAGVKFELSLSTKLFDIEFDKKGEH